MKVKGGRLLAAVRIDPAQRLIQCAAHGQMVAHGRSVDFQPPAAHDDCVIFVNHQPVPGATRPRIPIFQLPVDFRNGLLTAYRAHAVYVFAFNATMVCTAS